jgi:hypothetical protein
MNLTSYYLDLDKIKELSKEESNKIHDYYRDMIYCNEDGRKRIVENLFNTLYENGFLKNIRENKINEILNGDNSINH